MIEKIYSQIYKQVLKTRHPADLSWILVYPAIGILSIGIFALFLLSTGSQSMQPLFFVIAGALIWDFYSLSQKAITYGMMYDIWDACLKHGFVSKLSTASFLIGNGIFGLLSSFSTLAFVGVISYFAFNFNILNAGIYLLTSVLSTFIFATAIGIIIISMMLGKSKTYMSLTWILPGIIMVVSGVYYSVDFLPELIRTIANVIPVTHSISALRGALGVTGVNVVSETVYAFVSSVVLLAASILFFTYSLKKARELGNLVY